MGNCTTNRGSCLIGVIVLVGYWQRGSCPMGVIVPRVVAPRVVVLGELVLGVVVLDTTQSYALFLLENLL